MEKKKKRISILHTKTQKRPSFKNWKALWGNQNSWLGIAVEKTCWNLYLNNKIKLYIHFSSRYTGETSEKSVCFHETLVKANEQWKSNIQALKFSFEIFFTFLLVILVNTRSVKKETSWKNLWPWLWEKTSFEELLFWLNIQNLSLKSQMSFI